MSYVQPLQIAAALGMSCLLMACGNDSEQAPKLADYEITVVNATAAQPFSPLTLAFHSSSESLWNIGEPASLALEKMAEAGDGSELIASLTTSYGSATGTGLILPGQSETLRVTSQLAQDLRFSATTMLVNSNDAFAGLRSAEIRQLMVGETMQWQLPLYDAGTEFNSEMAGTIPGPADGGEGFNPIRDDLLNKISRHSGLVSQADDDLSVLAAHHRVLGQVAILTITRIH